MNFKNPKQNIKVNWGYVKEIINLGLIGLFWKCQLGLVSKSYQCNQHAYGIKEDNETILTDAYNAIKNSQYLLMILKNPGNATYI